MRKILTMLFVSFVILSCDKNDDGETTAITVPNQTELEQTVYADNTTGKSGMMTVMVDDTSKLESLVKKIKTVKGVKQVNRG